MGRQEYGWRKYSLRNIAYYGLGIVIITVTIGGFIFHTYKTGEFRTGIGDILLIILGAILLSPLLKEMARRGEIKKEYVKELEVFPRLASWFISICIMTIIVIILGILAIYFFYLRPIIAP